jgi:hypothetical protein
VRAEVHGHVVVGERGLAERVRPLDAVQRGAAMRPQRLAVRQQQIERAVRRRLRQQLAQRDRQLTDRRHAGVRLRQLLHQPAERALAVGVADRLERGVQARLEVFQVAVVREHPVAAPQLAHERVRVLQRHAALRSLADVGDDVVALDRVAPHELGHWRLARAVVIDERAQALVFEERNAEAVLVFLGAPRQTLEAEANVRGDVGVHAQQLTHGARGLV